MNDNNSFFSIDKLVEFGIGMSIAQQMVQTMNHSINSMQIPGTQNNFQQPTPLSIYAMIDGNQIGPLNSQEVTQLIQQKKLVNETYVWKTGMSDWELAEKVPEIIKLVALAPPPFLK